jgi:RND family efflux transporter MFP subunit
VEVAPVSSTESARDLVLSGTVEAERSWTLSFATAGTVQQVMVQEGAEVRRGQVLAQLSARSYQDALGIAKAKAGQADDAYRRLEPMYKNKTLPEVKMVEVETGREQARLMVSMARKAVADTVLRAPEAGVIARRQAEPGMNMAPGLPAFTLVQTKTMLATVPLPEKQIQRVSKGDRADVTVDALGRTIEGQVTEIGLSADILTRTYPVKVAISNTDGALRVGMIARVRLRQNAGGKALVLPSQAVHADGTGNNQVFVVGPDSRIQRRQVEVLGFLKEGIAVGSGVSEGELVVTSGTPMLGDGMLVRIRHGAPSDAGPGDARFQDSAPPDAGAGDTR